MKIGVIDSGVGGFSVLRELQRLMPSEDYFYLSDQDHAPYGDKDTMYLQRRLNVLTDELLKEQVDMVVIACHTATAEAIESLRRDYCVPFVGIEPYLNVLNNEKYKGREFVVLMTQTTAKSARFHALRERLDPAHVLNLYACGRLAGLIEKFFHDEISDHDFVAGAHAELEQVFALKQQFPKLTTAILGCTHYPLVGRWIEQITGLETLFPGEAVARRAKERLQFHFAYSADLNNSRPGFQYRRRVSEPWQFKAWNYLQKVDRIS